PRGRVLPRRGRGGAARGAARRVAPRVGPPLRGVASPPKGLYAALDLSNRVPGGGAMAPRTHITGRPHMSCAPVCHIVPPHILAMLAEEGGPEAREAAIQTLSTTAAIHARRAVVAQVLTQLDVGIRDLAFMAPPSGEANT